MTRPVSVIDGDRTLPVGSGVHGTSITGQDDRDEMGIRLEPCEFVTGLSRVPAGTEAGAATWT